VKADDVLNVRERPSGKAKKVASLPPEASVGVDRCQKVAASVWCRVYHMAQYDYEGYGYDAPEGWVNAHYLKPFNSGYVIIDGVGNCDYSLGCDKGMCKVVSDYTVDEKNNITALKYTKVKRERLHGESHFGAMETDEEASGYCTSGNMIQDYLHKKRKHALFKRDKSQVFHRTFEFVERLTSLYNEGQLLPYLHPKKGIIMTWNVMFGGKADMAFGYSDIKNMEKNRKEKIYWGQTYGKGDDVFMSLYDYMDMLSHPIADITKVEALKDLKGYKCPQGSECKGYEVFWINENSPTKEYDWQGLVVIVEKYKGKWYVVGLLRDRWTI